MDPHRSIQFRFVIPSRLSEVARVQEAVLEKVRAFDYPQDAIFAIRLALDEAVTNAIRHGNGLDPGKKVHIDGRVNPDRVCVRIEDEGTGFRPQELPDPTSEENLNRPHGRGVLLMNAYMTDVRFDKSGACVTLVKDRCCRKPTEA